jgi:hypothetical protein
VYKFGLCLSQGSEMLDGQPQHVSRCAFTLNNFTTPNTMSQQLGLGYQPLRTGLGYRARRKPEPQSVWFCLVLAPGFSLVFGTGLIFEVPNPNS